jgi:hypothetical protein
MPRSLPGHPVSGLGFICRYRGKRSVQGVIQLRVAGQMGEPRSVVLTLNSSAKVTL